MNSGLPRRCELPLSMGCRIQTTTQTSERGELSAPDHDRALLLTKNGLQSMTNTSQTSLQHSMRSKLGRSLLPFIATPGDDHTPFRDCKGIYRSAIAAVTPDGAAIGWLQRNSSSSEEVSMLATELDSRSVRWRSGFPRIAGPPVLSSGCWVHDGFQMLSGLLDAPTSTTRCRC